MPQEDFGSLRQACSWAGLVSRRSVRARLRGVLAACFLAGSCALAVRHGLAEQPETVPDEEIGQPLSRPSGGRMPPPPALSSPKEQDDEENDVSADQSAGPTSRPEPEAPPLVIGIRIADFALAIPPQPQIPSDTSPPRYTDTQPPAASQPEVVAIDEGPKYPVKKLTISYGKEHPDLPPISEVLGMQVELGRLADGYVAPRSDVPKETVRLQDVPNLPVHVFYGSAIKAINDQIVAHFGQRKLLGVFVTPDPEDIDARVGTDMRAAGNTELREIIWVGSVKQVRTIASGPRVPAEKRIDNPVHQRIKDLSPVQPADQAEERPKDLVAKDALDDYIFSLNRHPSRRVDVALSSAGRPGDVVMDYLVSENKPWQALFQLSNTGTKNTSKWREHFGFVHNQFTGHDDILGLDYVTAGFQQAHALVASYEAPFGNLRPLRWRLSALYSQFTASDVGQAGQDFTGSEHGAAGDLIWTVFQHRQLFVDVIPGVRWRRIVVNNELDQTTGRDDFILPHIGVRLERLTDYMATYALLDLEGNWPELAGTSRSELPLLGRGGAQDRWAVLHWNINQSVFLEPLLAGESCKEVAAPKTSKLAHELALCFKGQATRNRLIPQAEEVLGGLYTVRGYEESEVAGDSAAVASLEYRYHIPRALAVRENPQKVLGRTFRLAPQHPFARPDWDLVLKPFFDIGRATSNRAPVFERNQTLMSWGVGLELMVCQNVSVRCDWAMALKDIEGGTQAGDNRFHIVLTFSY